MVEWAHEVVGSSGTASPVTQAGQSRYIPYKGCELSWWVLSCASCALIAVGISVGDIYLQANWLQGRAATTDHCGSALQGPTPQSRIYFRGLWCPLSPPLQCVTWVVLQHGLKLSTGCAGSGASQEVQAKDSCCLCSTQGHPA